jgi:hypothetical protein
MVAMAATAIVLTSGAHGAQAPAQTAPCSGQVSGRVDNEAVVVETIFTCPPVKIEFTKTLTATSGSTCEAPSPKLEFEPVKVGGSLTFQATCSGTGMADDKVRTERKVRVTKQSTGITLWNWTAKRSSGNTREPSHTTQQDQENKADQSTRVTVAAEDVDDLASFQSLRDGGKRHFHPHPGEQGGG